MIKKEGKVSGFSLAEALITLLIVSLISLASVPVITKKLRKPGKAHGAFACYWNGDTLESKYLLNGIVSNGRTVWDGEEQRNGCIFDPPNNAKNFVATVVGGGGGGAEGMYREYNQYFIGEGSHVFTVPTNAEFEILLTGAGGAGGHTSSGQVKAKCGDQAPATSGSPGGLIVSDKLNLVKNATMNINIGVQGWAREENDGQAQEGQNSSLEYKDAYNNKSFKLEVQGGGGGASMNYDGSDRSHFYQCSNGGATSRNADSCTRTNGFYNRKAGSVKGNKESRPFLRSGHSGGARVSNLRGFSSGDFTEYIETASFGYASIYQYEKPGAFFYKCNDAACTSYSKGNKAASCGNSQGRPYRNSKMTPELMQKFKIWVKEDQMHPFGSGGYGSGGKLRNHNAHKGNGGPGVAALIWTKIYGGYGGEAGAVLQIPFAELPGGTRVFPGQGGVGGYHGYFPNAWGAPMPGVVYAGNGKSSYIKNYTPALGGKGAVTVNPDNSNTYVEKLVNGKTAGGNGQAANINPSSRIQGGAGGYTDTANNGYIDNNTVDGLTLPVFKENKAITMFSGLLGAGAGGGGGSATPNSTGRGASGSSGIVFIQW